MATSKITYQDKTNEQAVVDRTKQVTAEDLNEIKSVVNSNADELDNKTQAFDTKGKLANNLDADGNKIENLGDGENDGDTVNLAQSKHNTGISQTVFSKVYSNFKGEAVVKNETSGGTLGIATAISSTFDGWRALMLFNADFRAIEVTIRTENANQIIRCVIRNTSMKEIARGYYKVKEADTSENALFVFDKEIVNGDFPDGKFWAEWIAIGNVGVFTMTKHGDNATYYDQNTLPQYSTLNSEDWVDASNRSYISYFRMYSEDTVKQYDFENLSNNVEKNISVIAKSFCDKYSYDSETKIVNGTDSYDKISYGDPFHGWAADYVVQTGTSFNASRIAPIRRNTNSTDWHYIKFFLRKNLAEQNIAESKLINISDPTALELPTIEWAWLDPVTKQPITIDETLLGGAGAVYYFGFITYQKDKISLAASGLNKYTGSNDQYWNGNLFYNASTSEYTWAAASTDWSIAFDLLQWNNLQVNTHLKELDDFNIDTSVRVNLPEKYYAVVGMPLQLFYHGMIETVNPYKYNIIITCDIGNAYPRYFEITAASEDVGSHTFKIEIKNDAGQVLGSATSTIVVFEKATDPANQINILLVGDSLCNSDTDWGGRLAAMIVDGTDSLLPAIANIDLIGDFGTGRKKYVGFGGQTWRQYNTEQAEDPNTQDTWVTAAGHDKTEADDQESIWRDGNGNLWQLESVNGDKLLMKHYNQSNAMPNSGTLTHVANAVNTSDINYTAVDYLDRNPFWDDTQEKVDFHAWFADRYPTKESNGEKIDAVAVLLGWNGNAPYRKDYTDHITVYNDTKTFIDNVFASYPNATIFLMGIQMPSLNGGLGANYGANGGYSDLFGIIVSVIGLNLTYQKIADEYVAAGKDVQFIQISGQFDSENNMQASEHQVNIRNSVTELRGTNGVHPAAEGHLQIADAGLRALIAYYS